MIPARYFDGRSAKAIKAEVGVYGHTLVLTETESRNQHSFNLELMDITKGSEVVLSYEDIQIHVDVKDFKSLGIKQSFLGKERKPLATAISVAAMIVFVLYFTYRPILKFLAFQIPDEFFELQTQTISTHFSRSHCLSKSQEEHLKEIFGRLGKNYTDYKVYVIRESNVNAFAFPGNVMVIHDGLIKKVSGPEALAGVIAHEISHIEGKHVNIMTVKNFFIETIWAFAFDDNAISGVAKNLSVGLFSQEQEREADKEAAALLRDQHIDPKGTVEFFRMLEKEEDSYLKYLVLSHPAYPNRIKTFSEVYDSVPVLSEKAWEELKKGCL